jgi:hypothetical protein
VTVIDTFEEALAALQWFVRRPVSVCLYDALAEYVHVVGLKGRLVGGDPVELPSLPTADVLLFGVGDGHLVIHPHLFAAAELDERADIDGEVQRVLALQMTSHRITISAATGAHDAEAASLWARALALPTSPAEGGAVDGA